MMRALFITLSLISSAILTGCGFTPMHSTSAQTAPLANVLLDVKKGSDVIDNQAGFFMTQRLRDRMGTQNETPAYRLEVTPSYARRRLGLTNADVASRYDITLTANWVLFDAKSGTRLDKGRTRATTTFGAPEGPYGVITADNVGVQQTAKETADNLILALARYFASEDKK